MKRSPKNCWVSSFTVIVKIQQSHWCGLEKTLYELLPNHTHCSFRTGKIPNTKFTEWITAVVPGCFPFPFGSPTEPFTRAKRCVLSILQVNIPKNFGTNSLRSSSWNQDWWITKSYFFLGESGLQALKPGVEAGESSPPCSALDSPACRMTARLKGWGSKGVSSEEKQEHCLSCVSCLCCITHRGDNRKSKGL